MKTTILIILALITADKAPSTLPDWLTLEAPVIIAAAKRNGVTDESDIQLLFAIRQAERGGPGREFGIMNPKANNLDLQAAWAACTIRNHRKRHAEHDCGLDFVACLSKRYAPIGASNDPHNLNANWLRLVRYFLNQ